MCVALTLAAAKHAVKHVSLAHESVKMRRQEIKRYGRFLVLAAVNLWLGLG